MKFDSKPTQIEAVQFTGDNLLEVQEFVGTLEDGNTFGFRRTKSQQKEWPKGTAVAKLWVAANQEWLGIEVGEWIAKDEFGFYPIKGVVFRRKYQPSLDERARAIHGSTDAMEWAELFVAMSKRNPAIPFDVGTMVSWFASAIMAGVDETRTRDDLFNNCDVDGCPIEGWHVDDEHEELARQIVEESSTGKGVFSKEDDNDLMQFITDTAEDARKDADDQAIMKQAKKAAGVDDG